MVDSERTKESLNAYIDLQLSGKEPTEESASTEELQFVCFGVNLMTILFSETGELVSQEIATYPFKDLSFVHFLELLENVSNWNGSSWITKPD